MSETERQAFIGQMKLDLAQGIHEKPDAEEQARLDRVMTRLRRRGRPRIGKGAKRVLVTIEKDLLARADKFARKNGYTRAALIAHALQSVMSPAG
jgi:hypothetical protein